MFRTYLISSLLAMSLYGYGQYKGYDLFGSSAEQQKSAGPRTGPGGGRSSISHK